MSYTYGPVPSRRLGRSLGVDILPFKTCSINCIYCQLGRTTHLTVKRASFFPKEEILTEVIERAAETNPDYITFSGSGEPTLNLDIGWLIREFKAQIDSKVAVLTNSSLLWMPEVREELFGADLVVPSLDAATPEVWKRINRPHPDLEFDEVIEGLVTFSNEFSGELWVEILFVKGVNDSPEHIDALLGILSRMKHTKVQLNTVVRPPSERSAVALSYEELEAIAGRLPADTEAVLPYRKSGKQLAAHGHKELILSAIARRPMTLEQIEQSLGIPRKHAEAVLETLIAQGRVKAVGLGKETFYEAIQTV